MYVVGTTGLLQVASTVGLLHVVGNAGLLQVVGSADLVLHFDGTVGLFKVVGTLARLFQVIDTRACASCGTTSLLQVDGTKSLLQVVSSTIQWRSHAGTRALAITLKLTFVSEQTLPWMRSRSSEAKISYKI